MIINVGIKQANYVVYRVRRIALTNVAEIVLRWYKLV